MSNVCLCADSEGWRMEGGSRCVREVPSDGHYHRVPLSVSREC